MLPKQARTNRATLDYENTLSILLKYRAKSRENCSQNSPPQEPDPGVEARFLRAAYNQEAVSLRQTFTPAAAMAKTNQKMHMTLG